MAANISYNVCFCFRRDFKQSVVEAPVEIKTLFDDYSDENGVMNVDHLRDFLIKIQGEKDATQEEAQAILDSMKHLHIFHHHTKGGLDLVAFFKYLFGDRNGPLETTVGDMTASLSEYFMYTGHNSYLKGNQLSSKCSDIPIIESLQRGVRGIELDMWPNLRGNNVKIDHGRTLTSPVKLIKCLRSIKEHAFSASSYPVVLTLEDHLTKDLQAKVAKMTTQTFQNMLFSPGSECLKELPSPDSLKNKIIISTKPPKEYDQTKSYKNKEKSLQKETIPIKGKSWGREVSDLDSDFATHAEDDRKVAEDEAYEEVLLDENESMVEQNAEPEYKHLIGIHAWKRKRVIMEALKVDPNRVGRISLSEDLLERAMITHGKDIVRFTQRNLLRVYPKSTRVDSSNYNPLFGWMVGAQMVAFNMQGYGRSLWLMHGMFRANGGCGYVKKPDLLLKAGSNDEVFDPRVTLPVKTTFKVHLYMGDGWHSDFGSSHFDRYSPPDFYTRVGIAGVPADSIMKRTKTINDDWTPVWNEEFEFELSVPELALLRIEVHEQDEALERDDFGGQTCLPVWELRSGIRAVPLFDLKGVQYSSVKLLMHFTFEPK
ncbi:phosphoinositide phospholipase C [Ranunculus cassubicifolius]